MTASRRIVIKPYSARWPADFAQVEATLHGALGDIAQRIDHIGSTSVPGLAAKDVIDVQISVSDLTDPAVARAFERLGATATDIISDHVPPGDQRDPSAWEKRRQGSGL